MNMKKTFIATGLFLFAILSFAQTSEIMVFTNEKPIGRIMTTQEEIKTKEYIFPERKIRSYIDTTLKTITIQLRGVSDNGKFMLNRGNIIYYDLSGQKVKWTKKITYTTSNLQQFGSAIIFTTEGANFRLNNENGKNLWKAKNDIYFVDPVADIGVGYSLKYTRGYGNALEGIDLKTGKTIWQRELNREYGWNSAFRINDSEWMIVAAGLHTINNNDGTGWSYHAATGGINYTLASVLLTGTGPTIVHRGGIRNHDSNAYSDDNIGTYMFVTKHNLVWDIASNVYSDSTGYYFASKEIIARINKNNGEIVWINQFPNDLASKSSVFVKDDQVFMINYGYAFRRINPISYGTPFFAAFDKETGKQIFLSTINTTKNPILDFIIEDDILLLVFKDRIMKYSGGQILEKPINEKEFGELISFVGNRAYIDGENSSITSLIHTDISKNYIITNTNKILIVDDNLNIIGDGDVSQLYVAHLRIGNYVFVTKDNQTFILDSNDNKVAEIDIALKPILIGNKIYSVQENSFFEIDADNLIERLKAIGKRQEVFAFF